MRDAEQDQGPTPGTDEHPGASTSTRASRIREQVATGQQHEGDPSHWHGRARGTCPTCGSGQVRHTVHGMPTPETYESAPDGIDFAGCCLVVGGDRSCDACGNQWSAPRGPDPEDDDGDYRDADDGDG